MNVQFRQRCLSMLLVLVMLFTMMPVSVIAEEEHDHSHETTETPVVTVKEAVTASEAAELKVSAAASVSYMYVEEGPVSVDVTIAGGVAPYTVTLRAVKAGTVVSADSVSVDGTSARLTYAPDSYGDYELVVVVRDAQDAEALTSASLAVAEHDTESAQEWEASVSGASISADWASSLVSVAKTQVGYAESVKDFIIKSGEKQGYSRYGAWYGTPYAGWNNAFIAFVAEYANIPTDALLTGSSYRTWVNGMSAKDAYMPADGSYTPKAGDIAFLSSSRAAIIESVSGSTLTVIEGDVNGAVVRKQYSLSAVKGLGNTGLMMGLYDGSATPVPTQAPEVTEAPEGTVTAAPATVAPTAVPTATAVPEEEEELVFVATPTPAPGATVAPKDDSLSVLDQVVGQIGETVEEIDAAVTNVPLEFSDAYYLMQDELKALYAKYLGEGKKSAAEIKAFVDGLTLGDLYYATIEIASLADYAASIGLTDYEARALYEVEDSFSRFAELLEDRWTYLTVERTTVEVLDGQITVTDTANSNSVSDGVVTIKASGSLFSKKTNTVTITNETESLAEITFTYAISNANSFTIAGASITSGGTYSVVLEAGASLELVLTSNNGFTATTATLTLSNFTLTAAATSSNVTFEYDSTLGSITVGGTAVASGTTQEVTLADGVTLVATPNSGTTFQGWVDGNGLILSTATSYTLYPAAAMTVKAVFIGADSPAYFIVDESYLFDDLNDANDKGGTIVLANDGILPAGTYTISSGNTLLIPFDDAHTVYTNEPESDSSFNNNGDYVKPTAYRTMTMATGANIVINGSMSLSAVHHAANGGGRACGAPTGPVSWVKMEDGSSITVNNGGALYVWGYITGSGSVTAKSGAKIYENFQFEDFRGGTVTTQLAETDAAKGVFPIAQYYVQNIEVPLTLEAGATESSYTSVYISRMNVGAPVTFISSSDAMFNVTSGSVTKQYTGGRLQVSAQGTLEIATMTVSLGTTSMNTGDFELPINGNITVTVKSGSTLNINQDIAMLPGAQIIIESDAICNMNGNAYVYDADQWGGYLGSGGATVLPVYYAPGGSSDTDIVDAELIVNGTIKVAVGVGAYTTESGASITSEGNGSITLTAGSETITYQHSQPTSSFVEIPITSAKLKNADGSYTETINAVNTTYNYTNGKWVPDCADSHTLDGNYACVARTCTVCGTVVAATEDHSYTGAGTNVTLTDGAWKQDDCTVAGKVVFTCGCGDTYTTEYPAIDHTPDGEGEVTEPTCTTAGYTTYTCATCGNTYTGDTVEASHTIVTVNAKEPTCEEPGWDAYEYCSECDYTTKGEEIPATGHDKTDVTSRTEPTCIAEGSYTYLCPNCGNSYTESIPATGVHAYTELVEGSASGVVQDESGAWVQEYACVAGSVTLKCATCDETQTTTFEAAAHTEETVPGYAATCTTDGLTDGTRCSVCQTVLTEQEPISAPGHTYNESAEKRAVCGTYHCIVCNQDIRQSDAAHTSLEGWTCGDYTCSVCGESVTGSGEHDYTYQPATCVALAQCQCGATTGTVDSTNHAGPTEEHARVEPNCCEVGYTAGTWCTACKTYVSGHEEIKALGHPLTMLTVEVVIAPTCTESGYTEMRCFYYDQEFCTGEDRSYIVEGSVKEPTGHNCGTLIEEQAATCVAEGYKKWQCTNINNGVVCGEIWTETLEIDPDAHSWDAGTVKTAATCTSMGVTEYTCIHNSDHTKEETDIPVNADAHSWDAGTVKTAATCTAMGVTEYTCIHNSDHTKEETNIPVDPTAHTNQDGWTCGDYTCSECGEKITGTGNHAYVDENATQPTCVTEGYAGVRVCSDCGDTVYEATIPALGHDHSVIESYVGYTMGDDGVLVRNDCTEEAYIVYTCAREGCNEDVEGYRKAPVYAEVSAHAFGEMYTVTDSTCTAEGLERQDCANCAVYNEQAIAVKAHAYGEWYTSKGATCTEKGEERRDCADCDAYETRETDALDHDYIGEVTTEPTCTEAGEMTYTCQNDASHTYTEAIESNGHTLTQVEAKAATCEDIGWDAYEYCSVCDYTTYEEIAALNHNYIGEVTTEPTCTEAGVKTYTCQNDASHTYTEEIEATGHTLTQVEAKAATCEEIGWAAYEYCSVCDYTTYEEIAALNHNYIGEVTTEPTCTEAGVKTYTCQNDASHTYTEEIESNGHTLTQVEAKAATCEEIGWAAYEYCSVCDYTTYEEIEALTHDYVSVVTDPTCTEQGYTTHTCQREGCGDSYVDTYTDVLGHQYVSVTTAPGCFTDGYTTHTCQREGCGYSYKDNYTNAIGNHTVEVTIEAKAPTCTEAGWTAEIKCVVCDSYYEQYSEQLDPLDHLPNIDAATCTEDKVCKRDGCGELLEAALGHAFTDGLDESVACHDRECERCGVVEATEDHQFSEEEKGKPCIDRTCLACSAYYGLVSATAEHEPDEGTTTKEATCTEEGVTTFTCTVCGAITGTAPIEMAAHQYEAGEPVPPTCTEQGYTVYTCKNCPDSYQDDFVSVVEHAWVAGEILVEPGCETTGTQQYNCEDCTATKTETIPVTGHTLTQVEAQAATCEEIGWAAYEYCSVCDYTTYEEIPALNHNYVGEVTTEPTCTEAGVKTYTCQNDASHTYTEEIEATGHTLTQVEAQAATCEDIGWDAYEYCSVCDYTTYVEIPAAGHNPVTDEAVDATCTETGLTEGSHCDVCDTVLVEQEEVPALDHDWDEGEVTTPNSCTTAGEMTYTCQREGCGETRTEPIFAAHTVVVDEAVDPTCTETGLTEGSHCSVCGEIIVAQEIIPAAHSWAEDEIITEATCTTEGQMSVYCTAEGCDATDTVTIPALGHTEVIDAAVEETCEVDGLTEGKHCSVCGEVTVAQEVIPHGHKWNVPPCTDGAAYCERCELTNEALLEHDMAPATCTAPATCKYNCGYTEGNKLPHTVVIDEEIPPLCEDVGYKAGTHCSVCGTVIIAQEEVAALGHDIQTYEGKRATYTSAGWEPYEACTRCAYTTKVEIPMLDPAVISSYDEFMANLPLLEQLAVEFAKQHPETEPVSLIIKYIRTGVDRYNSGSWGIMAGYENADFAKYVYELEDAINSSVEDDSQMIKVSGLKNLLNFALPNGNVTDFGHMFGTMDITYSNPNSQNHADVGGWTGDLVDLLSTADLHEVESITGGELEDMATMISDELLCKNFDHPDVFSQTDMYGDLDAYYVMLNLDAANYEAGDMSALFTSYFTTELTDEDRAKYLLENRLDGVSTRSAVRDAVYTAYTSNNVISTLEGTRDFVNTTDLNALRKAVCYSFADYLCRLAGDYVDVTENPYLTVFESAYYNLAPGIKMETHKATSADNKQMAYYLAYADVGRSDVDVLASYQSRTPTSWGMTRVIDQGNYVQELYGDPESEEYIENFNVIAGINGAGFNMATGEPGGLLVMNGVEYHPADSNGFFGITKSGYAVIGSTDTYYAMKDQIQEGIAGFGTMLVENGELAITATSDYYTSRASRTAVGITSSGKVVFMVLDGRQEPWSCGGSMIEIAQIMLNAGCVTAINLDGGGSTTFIARQVGDEELSVVNRPSDGVSRSVSTALLMVSTAPSSTAFDHALVESDYNYLTVDTSIQMTATGMSATNNIVDLPEGTTWAVSDERWGMITEDGVFTALRNGSVNVYLMLDDVILGQKTLNIVVPDQLYFTKDKIDSVYGASVQLPLKARYEGKEVAISAKDISFTLSNDTAGEMQGFFFVAATESTIKTVTITAALAANSAITAAIDVVLYEQGENSFDFDQATDGSRTLAWQRTVSNATTADDSVYYVVDPDEDMVTSYIIALDMTQIPIPDRLADLTYMLPGADMEGASAWGFLLQLAERISVLTEVKPQITFDPNFDVDYSELKLINDYFVLNGTDFDEETNTLTLTLNWIDQTAPIPAETANPMCIVNGLKITPKEDAAWDEKDRLIPVNSGSISYTIYMRANALYSFSQKTENQETFGLYPFTNPNDENEKGGYFQDTYTTFSDTYTLVRTLKNGWYNEESGFRYYVDGVYYTGVMEVDGLYYDFGTDGINIGQTTYTGLHVMNGDTYYIQLGLIKTGWYTINGDWYLFDYTTGVGLNGIYNSGTEGVDYEFENGRLLYGVWLKDDVGLQYFYGPEHYYIGWKTIDGERYYFEDYYVKTGILPVKESHNLVQYWYEFTDEGIYVGYAPDGLHWYEGELYYVTDGLAQTTGLILVDGYYYYLKWNSTAYRSQSYWITELNGLDLEAGCYRFDELGRMIMTTEIVNEDGTLYYYKDGMRAGNAGLIEYEGYYYYIIGGGMAIVNQAYWITETNGLVPAGQYRFDENGHMLMDTAIVEEDGKLYYCENGVLTFGAGLVQVDGDYYYINGSAQAVTDTTMYVSKTNGLLDPGTYTFGSDGKLVFEEKLNGIVNGYYYVEGVKTEAGLLLIDGEYYYAGEGGKIVTDQLYTITDTNDLLDAGAYRFDEEGKIIMGTELVDEDGALTYYEDGRLAEDAGLILYDGDYYYITEDGTAVINTTMLVEKTNDLLPEDTYSFGADGKLFERLAGDADDNGVVDLYDTLAVLQYDSGEDVVINIVNADVNGDQRADIYDALLIMQYDAGWDVTLK